MHQTKRIAIYTVGIVGLMASVFLTSCTFLSGLLSVNPIPPTGVASTTPTYNAAANGDNGGYQITISWDAVGGATSYNVYHTYGPASTVTQPIELQGGGTGANTYENINPITTNSYLFTMGTADPAGYVFYFAVSSVNNNGESTLSTPAISVTVP